MRGEQLPGDAWFTAYAADTDPADSLRAFMNPQQYHRPPLLGSFVHGPVRDTLLMGLGGLLVAIGYVLGAIVTAGGA